MGIFQHFSWQWSSKGRASPHHSLITRRLRVESPPAVSLSCLPGLRHVQFLEAMPELTDWNSTCAPVFAHETARGQQRFQLPGYKSRALCVTGHCEVDCQVVSSWCKVDHGRVIGGSAVMWRVSVRRGWPVPREAMLALRRKRRDALPASACLTYSSQHLTQRFSLAPVHCCLGGIEWQSDAHILV